MKTIECMRNALQFTLYGPSYECSFTVSRIIQNCMRNFTTANYLPTWLQQLFSHKCWSPLQHIMVKSITWTPILNEVLLECILQKGAHIPEYGKTSDTWEAVNEMFFAS